MWVCSEKRLNDGKWNVGGGIKETESAGKRKKEINKETDVKIRREIDKAERQKCIFFRGKSKSFIRFSLETKLLRGDSVFCFMMGTVY